MSPTKYRTFIYIDGFNLYNGCLKGTKYKWLNLKKLCENLLKPEYEIQSIKYYSAPIHPWEDDPKAPERQRWYWEALKTIPELKIKKGYFQTHEVTRKLVQPLKIVTQMNGQGYVTKTKYINFVKIYKNEEKKTDVNIATDLIIDAVEDKFDAAVVISNDCDLVPPIHYVKSKKKKRLFVVTPHEDNATELKKHSTKALKITEEHLKNSLFDNEIKVSDKKSIKNPF